MKEWLAALLQTHRHVWKQVKVLDMHRVSPEGYSEVCGTRFFLACKTCGDITVRDFICHGNLK